MRFGIDFGTTRTVVACCDRGNYPILGFRDADDDAVDWLPSVIAVRGDEVRYGFATEAVAGDPEWTLLRSFKRLLTGPDAAPERTIELGGRRHAVGDLLAGYLLALREMLPAHDGEVDAVVAVPANAHGTQRFLTLDAFRRAGFRVRALVNEPSAAGFEYTHRYRDTVTAKREHVVVYDLGGGTFDASLVRMRGRSHEAVATAGLNHLGGDDFDDALADLALAAAGRRRADTAPDALRRLTDLCREAKERLTPSSRKLALDWNGEALAVPVADYYAACAPLVDRTLDTMAPLLRRLDDDGERDDVAGIYVVGGASALPLVGRALRERWGRRVHRSPYPFAAVAIGLAIAADDEAGFALDERFARHFGVFREARGGREVAFDVIFAPGGVLGGARHERTYRAAHNLGHFRFVECATVDAGGAPRGDITPSGDVLFPFDPGLRGADRLAEVPVRRLDRGPLIREEYAVDQNGIVAVTITDLDSGYRRGYRIGA
ncbi:MAG TPA: Hsp70 family protein [Haliangiales bacterium]|nr:Hsp70 family protein [Haliangiales bacterium]